MTAADDAAAGLRPLLFSIAYGMTGSVGDAEDIVQDAMLGLVKARRAGTVVGNVKAYLTTAVTRLGINHLGSARVRRETYVGAWLPEPVVTAGPAEHAELADALSMAFLVMLEALSPVERAVFMLREVFGYGYADVAASVGRSEVNCRQIFARARQRITADDAAPDHDADRRAEAAELAGRFFEAASGGDLESLLALLAPDVVIVGDGGGKAPALANPPSERLQVARLFIGGFRRLATMGMTLRTAWVNGLPGAVLSDRAGRVAGVVALEPHDGMIHAVRAVLNPDKLSHLGATTEKD